MTVEAGDPGAALEFLIRLYEQTQDERLREALEQRIRGVSAERDIAFLQDAVHQYQHRYGRMPVALQQLVAGGILIALPDEPFGGKYEVRPDGTVASTGLPERLRVHRTRDCRPSA
jgi:hypothetical protein